MKNSHFQIRFWFTSILLSLVVSVTSLRAAEGTNYYLPQGKIDVVALLAPPPLPNSGEQAADLDEVRSVHLSHPASEETIALLENTNLSLIDFAPVFGVFSQSGKVPKTEAFFHRIFRDTGRLVGIGKDYWKRDRPFITDPSLAQGDPTPGFSYPSGHSTIGTVYALVLAEMFPEKRDAILAIGRNIGWHRVMLAKHYPTDVIAGRVLAQAIFRELDANPDFQHDLAEAKAEITANMSRE
jgi:acid phosphatase (class A)